jgi:hypothetical protein
MNKRGAATQRKRIRRTPPIHEIDQQILIKDPRVETLDLEPFRGTIARMIVGCECFMCPGTCVEEVNPTLTTDDIVSVTDDGKILLKDGIMKREREKYRRKMGG